MTTFWLRSNLRRDTAPVPASWFCNTDRFVLPAQLVPRHSVNASVCNPTAKTRAIPSLHRDYFSAKAPGRLPDASSGNAYFLNRRAVSCQAGDHITLTANAQASLLQPVPTSVLSLQNTCFFACPDLAIWPTFSCALFYSV